MWTFRDVLLFVTLFQENSHIAMCEVLHLCPHSSQHSCLSLSQFANGQKNHTRPNTTLIFNEGNHTTATGIVVSNVAAFSMISAEDSRAVIICQKDINDNIIIF